MSLPFDISDTFDAIGSEFGDIGRNLGELGSKLLEPITGNEAAKRARDAQTAIDNKNIDNFVAESDEELRRMNIDNQFNQGMATTQIGASGFASGGSMGNYLFNLQKRQSENVDWLIKSTSSQVGIMKDESEARRRNSDVARKKNNITSVVGVLSTVGSVLVP